MANSIYIAASLDGYIADKNGGLDWLPSPDGADFGYEVFMQGIDALVMGKNTFETVLGFGGEWPYTKKVFVVSHTLKSLPKDLQDRVELIQGSPSEIVRALHDKGYQNLYIDGGKTIQAFLKEGLIDELIITTIPVLLGGGISLFGTLEENKRFQAKETKIIAGSVQTHFVREK